MMVCVLSFSTLSQGKGTNELRHSHDFTSCDEARDDPRDYEFPITAYQACLGGPAMKGPV